MKESSKPSRSNGMLEKLLQSPVEFPEIPAEDSIPSESPRYMGYEWFLRTSEVYLPASNRVRHLLQPEKLNSDPFVL